MPEPFSAHDVGNESWRHQVRRPEGVVVLASGGVDSAVLIGWLARKRREVYPLFVKSGLVWESAEVFWLRKFLSALPPDMKERVRPLRVVSLPTGDLYGEHWSTTGEGTPEWSAPDNTVYLPGRNILLLSKAAVHAALLGVPRVALGPLAGNTFPDASPKFFKRFQRALAQGLDFPLKIETPFLGKTKRELIALGGDLPLDLTFSCSNPIGRDPCGVCAKCRERTLAFRRP